MGPQSRVQKTKSRPGRGTVLVLCGLGLGLVEADALAQDFEGARLLGFGGARRALGTGNDAIYANPAGLGFAGTYELEFAYADDFRESDRQVNISIADGQAGPVAGGLALTYGRFRPPEASGGDLRLEGLRLDVGVAVPATPEFSLGANVRFADYRLLDDEGDIEDGGTSGLAVDAGIQWRLTPQLAVGATLQNLGAADQPELPRSWGAGVGYRGGAWALEVDVEHAWETREPHYTGSFGYVVADRVPLRAAVTFLQGTEEVALSVGAGVSLDRWSIDLAYRQTLNPRDVQDDSDARLFVAGLRVLVF